MDPRLVAWARQVKARSAPRSLPPLWLFTDEYRVPNPLPAIAALPPGLCGVVFRHDNAPHRIALARKVARLCRSRRLALSVAGDWRLAATLHAGLHLRAPRSTAPRHPGIGFITSSAHGRAQLLAASRSGASLVFLSPVFPTASHPGGQTLGPIRWRLAALGSPVPVAALGGITGRTRLSLPRSAAAGAIGALSTSVIY